MLFLVEYWLWKFGEECQWGFVLRRLPVELLPDLPPEVVQDPKSLFMAPSLAHRDREPSIHAGSEAKMRHPYGVQQGFPIRLGSLFSFWRV